MHTRKYACTHILVPSGLHAINIKIKHYKQGKLCVKNTKICAKIMRSWYNMVVLHLRRKFLAILITYKCFLISF